MQDPGRDCDVNVRGTLNVLEAAGAHGAPVVFTSTGGALYGDEAPRPTPEDRIPAPLSPYGASKWAAEAYVRTWALLVGDPAHRHAARQRLRPAPEPARRGRGGGDLHRRTSTRAARRRSTATASRRATTSTSPTSSRRCSPPRGTAGVYNVATGVETDVMAIWRGLSETAGVEHRAASWPTCGRASCSTAASTSPTRAAELGWAPKVAIDEGLAIDLPGAERGIRPAGSEDLAASARPALRAARPRAEANSMSPDARGRPRGPDERSVAAERRPGRRARRPARRCAPPPSRRRRAAASTACPRASRARRSPT